MGCKTPTFITPVNTQNSNTKLNNATLTASGFLYGKKIKSTVKNLQLKNEISIYQGTQCHRKNCFMELNYKTKSEEYISLIFH